MLMRINLATGDILSNKYTNKEICIDDIKIYLEGKIDGTTTNTYEIDTVFNNSYFLNIQNILPKLCGKYTIVSVRSGIFNFAVADLSGVNEIYYGQKEKSLIVGNNFLDLGKEIGTLTYDTDEVTYFINHGYCRTGKTTFREINRLPPGKILKLKKGKVNIENYVDSFKGDYVDYRVFRNALESTVETILNQNQKKNNIVLLSGGVDSSTILGILRKKDVPVSAITMSSIPHHTFDANDVIRSVKIAELFGIDHEFIDIDFNMANIEDLRKTAIMMPLAAHLSINFIKTFESLSKRNVLCWCGQNMDTLYNLGPTEKFAFFHRFLISSPYINTLIKSNYTKKYRILKNVIDKCIKSYYLAMYHKRAIMPNNADDLLHYFSESDEYLAISFASNINGYFETHKNYSTLDVEKMLFDEKLGSFFTGRDNKVVFNSANMFGAKVELPYSNYNMVHLFRNLDRGLIDVFYPKRFLYTYFKNEFGVSEKFFHKSRIPVNSSIDLRSWEDILITSTSFGKELTHNMISLNNLSVPKPMCLQNMLSLFWIKEINKKLVDGDVKISDSW